MEAIYRRGASITDRFAHVGHEYRYVDGMWQHAEAPVAQIENVRDVHHSVVALVASARHRAPVRYSLGERLPHHYLDALRPADLGTDFGDRAG